MTETPAPNSAALPGWYPASDGPFERWWDGNQWTAHTRPLGSAEAGRGVSNASRIAGWVIVGFASLVAIGALLPWASVGAFNVSGTSGDGVITLPLALLMAALGIVRGVGTKATFWQIGVPVVGILTGFLVTLIGVYDSVNISETATVGGGLILTILGGLGLIGASIFGLIRRQ